MSGNREEIDEEPGTDPGRGGGSRQARERLQEQTDEEIPEDEITVERGRDGFRPSVSEDFQRRRAMDQLQDATGTEIPESQFTFSESDDGITAGVAEEFQREQVEQQVREETGFDLEDDEIVVERVDGQYQARVTEEAQREQAIRALQESTEQEIPGPEIVVEQTDEGIQAGVSKEFQREQAITALLEETDDVPESQYQFDLTSGPVERRNLARYEDDGDRQFQRARAKAEIIDSSDFDDFNSEDFNFSRSGDTLTVNITEDARQDALEDSLSDIAGEEVTLGEDEQADKSPTNPTSDREFGGTIGPDPTEFPAGNGPGARQSPDDTTQVEQPQTDTSETDDSEEEQSLAELTSGAIALDETEDGIQARFTDDFQEQRVREDIQESTEVQVPDEEIIVGPSSSGGFRGKVSDDFQREQLRESIQESTDAQIPESEIIVDETGDGFEASVGEGFQREQLRESIQTATDEEIPEDEIVIEETDDGFQANVAEDFQRDILREELQESTDFNVPESAIEFSEEPTDVVSTPESDSPTRLQVSISEDFQRQRLREQLQDQTDYQVPESAIQIDETDDGLKADIGEDFQRQRLREQIQEETDFNVPESAIEIEEETDVVSTPESEPGTRLEASISEDFQRQRLREQLQDETEQKLPESAIEVQETDEGFVGSVSEEYQREQIRQDIQESTDAQIPESAIEVFEVDDLSEVTDQYREGEIDSDQLQEAIETGKRFGFTGGLAGRVSDEYQREQARDALLEDVDPETEVDLSEEDVVVDETDGGFEARLSEETLDEVQVEQRQATREQIANELGVPAAAVSRRFGESGEFGVRDDWAEEIGLRDVPEATRETSEPTSGFADSVREDIDSGEVSSPTVEGGFAESVADQFEQPAQQEVTRAISRVGGVTESERQFTEQLDRAEADAAEEISAQVRRAQAEQIGLSGTESLDPEITEQLGEANDVTADDVDSVQTDDGVQFELDQDQREEIVAARASLATGTALEAGEDVRTVEAGRSIQGVEGTTIREGETVSGLTETGREVVRESRLTQTAETDPGAVSSAVATLTSGGEGIDAPTEQEAQAIAESDPRINVPDTPEEGVAISDLPGVDRVFDTAGAGVNATVAAGDAVITPVAQASAQAGTTLENRIVEPGAGIIGSALEDVPATTAGTEVVGGRDAGTFTEPGTQGGRQAQTAVETVGKLPTTLIGAGDTQRLADRSQAATEATTSTIVEPGAGIVGSALEDVPATTAGTEVVGGRDAGTFTEPGTQGGRIAERFTQGAGTEVASLTVGAPSLAVGAGSTTKDVGSFVGEEFAEEGVIGGTGAVASAGGSAAVTAGDRAVRSARRSPATFAGTIAGGAALSAGAGAAVGRGARALRQRARTAGATEVDADDLGTTRVIETVEEGGRAFPGADDPGLYQRAPSVAVRRQARDNTPDVIREAFDDAGATDGPVIKKALDVDPDGPGAAGFRTREGTFESPGSFVSPELSPRFLRVDGQDPEFSLRPGLPSLGDSPTAVAVRTDVQEPRASDLTDFNEELLERSGETTARTKPASEVNTGEIEAVIPPESKFVDIGSGPIRDPLRRVGIGADFATEVGGTRIPIRTVAPESDLDPGSPGLSDFFSDTRGQAGARTAGSRVERDIRRSRADLEQPVDRPLPLTSGISGGSSSGSRDFGVVEYETGLRESDRGVSSRLERSRSAPSTSAPSRAPGAEGVGFDSDPVGSGFDSERALVDSPTSGSSPASSTTGGSSAGIGSPSQGLGSSPSESIGGASQTIGGSSLSSGSPTSSVGSPVGESGGSSALGESGTGSSGVSETTVAGVSIAGGGTGLGSSTRAPPIPEPDDDFQLPLRDVTARQRRQVRELPDPSQNFVGQVATDPDADYGLSEDQR